MGIANSNNMGKYWTRPERHRATLKNVQRYIAQDPEKWSLSSWPLSSRPQVKILTSLVNAATCNEKA